MIGLVNGPSEAQPPLWRSLLGIALLLSLPVLAGAAAALVCRLFAFGWGVIW